MTRIRTLLALALATALGLAVAQGMMGAPNDPRVPADGYGNRYGNYAGHGMMQPGYGGYGPGGMGMMGGGMMGGGMMGGYGTAPWETTPNGAQARQRFDEGGARELAATFLAGYLPGAEVLAGQAFAGYVTFDYGRDGRIDGMLNVHLGSGQVWPHTWHGVYRGDAGGHEE